MAFKNFSIWRGRLPHWRADDVTYYVTFRHRRDLTVPESTWLKDGLVKADGKQWELLIACVLPGQTDLLFRVRQAPDGRPYELSQIVEKVKVRVGKQIIKKSEERFSPFYGESYDRIVRDDGELEARWQEILDSPVNFELCEDPEEYPGLWVANHE